MTIFRLLSFFIVISISSAIILPHPKISFNTENILEDFDEWKNTREQFVKYSKDYPFGWPSFQCFIPSEIEPPKNVHSLAPWHISIVGAMGDSLTAGRAAKAATISGLKKEFRGISFAIGADDSLEQRATIPNVFSYFSEVTGASHHISTESNLLLSQFNVAKSGALSSDLPRQARELVKRMKRLNPVKFHREWKYVNIFIGSNDLCNVCVNSTDYSSSEYASSIREAVNYLRNNLPRTYVNLMPAFNVEILAPTQQSYSFCADFHRFSCPCLSDLSQLEYSKIKTEWDSSLFEFHEPHYHTEDFTVAVAPVISNVSSLPKSGSSLNVAFAALDCFHFSSMAHDMVAKVVWNSLFDSVFEREEIRCFDDVDPRVWKCPPEDCPYLRTVRNSLNCHESWPPISFAKEKEIVENPIIPSQQELERRANEGTNTLVLIVLGTMCSIFMIAVAVVLIQHKKRSHRKSNERTPLLLTANLYDDVF